jgi:gamma-glutamyltranspeptidase/glutathione hydrolase
VASDDVAEEASNAALLDGASAVAACLCGYFAAAGQSPGVLMSPMVLISVSGRGTGRVFDGRLRQPGIGAKRPRGFAEGGVPDAAWVAAPSNLTAAAVALAYDQGTSWARVLRPGLSEAKRVGAEARLRALQVCSAEGRRALEKPPFSTDLLRAAGPAAGGNLTAGDLKSVPEVDHALERRVNDADVCLVAPFGGSASEPPVLAGRVVCAVDAHGKTAALYYEDHRSGVALPELELCAPRAAVPVRRGVPRTSPGSFLPVVLPLEVGIDESGGLRFVRGREIVDSASRVVGIDCSDPKRLRLIR